MSEEDRVREDLRRRDAICENLSKNTADADLLALGQRILDTYRGRIPDEVAEELRRRLRALENSTQSPKRTRIVRGIVKGIREHQREQARESVCLYLSQILHDLLVQFQLRHQRPEHIQQTFEFLGQLPGELRAYIHDMIMYEEYLPLNIVARLAANNYISKEKYTNLLEQIKLTAPFLVNLLLSCCFYYQVAYRKNTYIFMWAPNHATLYSAELRKRLLVFEFSTPYLADLCTLDVVKDQEHSYFMKRNRNHYPFHEYRRLLAEYFMEFPEFNIAFGIEPMGPMYAAMGQFREIESPFQKRGLPYLVPNSGFGKEREMNTDTDIRFEEEFELPDIYLAHNRSFPVGTSLFTTNLYHCISKNLKDHPHPYVRNKVESLYITPKEPGRLPEEALLDTLDALGAYFMRAIDFFNEAPVTQVVIEELLEQMQGNDFPPPQD